MIQDFARVLREKLRTDMNNYADDLASGACRNFDDTKNSAESFKVLRPQSVTS
jgi:hypothetical protein